MGRLPVRAILRDIYSSWFQLFNRHAVSVDRGVAHPYAARDSHSALRVPAVVRFIVADLEFRSNEVPLVISLKVIKVQEHHCRVQETLGSVVLLSHIEEYPIHFCLLFIK